MVTGDTNRRAPTANQQPAPSNTPRRCHPGGHGQTQSTRRSATPKDPPEVMPNTPGPAKGIAKPRLHQHAQPSQQHASGHGRQAFEAGAPPTGWWHEAPTAHLPSTRRFHTSSAAPMGTSPHPNEPSQGHNTTPTTARGTQSSWRQGLEGFVAPRGPSAPCTNAAKSSSTQSGCTTNAPK